MTGSEAIAGPPGTRLLIGDVQIETEVAPKEWSYPYSEYSKGQG
jgi:hypothetical protein